MKVSIKIKDADKIKALKTARRNESVESGFNQYSVQKPFKNRKRDADKKACRKFKYSEE